MTTKHYVYSPRQRNNNAYKTSNCQSRKMQTEQLPQISEPIKPETSSLLSKYDIPVSHLDYEYINRCTDAKELEKIVLVLRSNEEGHFPHLTQVAEEKLRALKPKSKVLHKNAPVISKEALSEKEQEEIQMDLQEFVKKMNDFDSELTSRGKTCVSTSEIRQAKEMKEENRQAASNRIKSTDYASWDKYDVDTECLKIDLEEEKLKKAVKETKKPLVKPVTQFSTTAEAEFEANREKLKGNESYKNADYDEAIQHYTNSIEIKPISTTYTNRAMANIKIKNYGDAIEDCKAALQLDRKNIKAYIRLAEIYEFLNKFTEALENIDSALVLDANNVTVQNIAGRLKKHRTSTKKMRFKIQCTSECRIPIPGTSSMGPPFYVVVSDSSKQCVVKKPQLLHFVNTDNLDAEECTVNHLESRCSKNWGIKAIASKKSLFTLASVDRAENRKICENGSGDSNKVKCIVLDGKKNERLEENKKAYFNVDINTPFAFLNAWNSAAKDSTYRQKAMILKKINFKALNKIIGSKLDSKMLTDILLCLRLHFLQPENIDNIHGILTNLPQISRFSIIKMFLTKTDFENFAELNNFLDKHNQPLSNDIKNLYK